MEVEEVELREVQVVLSSAVLLPRCVFRARRGIALLFAAAAGR